MEFKADLMGLLKFAGAVGNFAGALMPAAVEGLNEYGDEFLYFTADGIAQRLNLDVNDVIAGITVRQADVNNPTWEMDASNWDTRGQGRPWPSREGSAYARQQLLNVIGYLDCCDVCRDFIADSPHTAEEIDQKAKEWANYIPPHPVAGPRTNLLHPNCRCATQPFASELRRVTVSASGFRTRSASSRDLAAVVVKHLNQAIRISIKK